MPAELRRLFIVPHSHWDREWYQPFQAFRARLVRMVDKLLTTLEEDPDFRCFVLDGQTIVLEDYLEIRPENEGRLRRLIAGGRILIGPWYILPDEFLVGGESIIRNLLRGQAICRDFGSRMRVGYLPDQFGHVAQMPQLLARAGLPAAAAWRGVPPMIDEDEFRWEAPDGSGVFCVFLSNSYSNGATLPLDPTDLETRLDRIVVDDLPFNRTGLVLVMNGSDHLEPQPGLPAAVAGVAEKRPEWQLEMSNLADYVEAAVAARLATAPRNPLRVLRGELRSPARSPMLVGVTSARMGQKTRHFRLSSALERLAEPAAAWSWALGGKYPEGELRAAWKLLLQNEPHDSVCGCSIDQVHREMETRYDWGSQIAEGVGRSALEAIAARVPPATCVVFNLGGPDRTELIEGTLQAPPGDLEAVAPDGTAVPVQRVESQEEVLMREALSPLKLRAMLPLVASREVMGHFINGYDHSRVSPDTVEVRLVMGRAPVGQLDVAELKALAQKLLEDRTIRNFRILATSGVNTRLAFVADLPAGGWRSYRLRPTAAHPAAMPRPTGTQPAATGRAAAERLSITPRSLANDFFVLDVNPNGSLRLTDRRTGVVYPAVNRFVDDGDAGDEYNYCPPPTNLVIDRPAGVRSGLVRRSVRTSVVESGPARATLEIRLVYRLPAGLAGDREARDRRRLVDVPVTTRISLAPGLPRVDFTTTVDNRAADHRLRVHFEAPFATDQASAEAQFAVVNRPLGEPGDPAWAEQPIGTKPHKGFVDISDGRAGLAILTRGLPEYEVMSPSGTAGTGPSSPGSPATLALTLLRCVGWLSRDDLSLRPGHAGPGYPTPEAQCLGQHSFEYAVIPHAGDWLTAGVATATWAYTTPPVLAQGGAQGPTGSGQSPGPAGSLPAIPLPATRLPAEGSFLRVVPSTVRVSAIKKAEAGDEVIVRVWNHSPGPVTARLETLLPVASWRPVSLLEEPLGEPSMAPLAVDLGPWEIASLALDFSGPVAR